MEIMVLMLAVLLLFVFAITKGTDANMRGKGEDTPAPESARWVFILIVAGGLFVCIVATAPAAMLGR